MVLMDLFTFEYATDHYQLLTNMPDVQLPKRDRVYKQILNINSSQMKLL